MEDDEMTTVLGVIALSAYVSTLSLQPTWYTSYDAALEYGVRQNKPLAVFLAPGKASWDKLLRDGTLSEDAQRLLRSKYVPVYLNTDTPEGAKLASSFDLPDGIGVVLSDREGSRQAFWHQGALDEQQLTSALERHADPDGPVVLTETNLVTQASNYSPAPAPATAVPAYTAPATFPFQPAYSPSCSH
jgi:hypothetical protein